jgi:SAM-dependent methyltransferase
MPLGPRIREMFGPYEHQLGEIYRSVFVDIDAFVEQILAWKPTAARILEVGCGEGAVTERLTSRYPSASVTAIDVSPRLGRLYRGSVHRLQFIRCTAQEVAAAQPGEYDLVVLADVLHHVPVESRQGLLEAIKTALVPGGTFVFKDWQRTFSPIHWLGYASDRWLTGDRISYMSRAEMRERLAHSFGAAALISEATVPPWRNNIATLVARPITG